MMKSEQKVVSELKSVLMLTSQSMMGLWEAEKANQTKKIDKLSKIVEQLQAAVVDLNQGPKRNASLPMNRPALPKMKTPVEETPPPPPAKKEKSPERRPSPSYKHMLLWGLQGQHGKRSGFNGWSSKFVKTPA